GLREGQLLHGLALTLLRLGDLPRELVRAVRPASCRRCGLRGLGSRAATALATGDLEPQLLELPLARRDTLRVLAERPLHFLDLGERLLVAPPHVQRFAHTGSVSAFPAGG